MPAQTPATSRAQTQPPTYRAPTQPPNRAPSQPPTNRAPSQPPTNRASTQPPINRASTQPPINRSPTQPPTSRAKTSPIIEGAPKRPGTPTVPLVGTEQFSHGADSYRAHDSGPVRGMDSAPTHALRGTGSAPMAGPAIAGAPTRAKPTDPPRAPRPTAKPPGNAVPSTRQIDMKSSMDVAQLIEHRLTIMNSKSDHFALLGIARTATFAQIRDAYFLLARQLHPDRLSALGIPDENRRAQRLFAEVNAAFATLSDPVRREHYVDILSRGGEAAIKAEQQKAEEMALRILESEEAYRRGEMALRRDSLATAIRELEYAIQLNPEEPDYHATLAWAKFASAPDKMAVATSTRAALEQAIRKSPRAVTARFFLGRVERMLGKDQKALELFQEVLRMQPGHGEATAEVRVLEARLGSDKGGLFGRLKR
ncbi:MAG: DnaJ domain-containing protein [Kofleriaceae bacterium]